MASAKWILLFLISYSTNVLSGLLPDNIIYIGHNRCCSVKNLELGDLVVSSQSCQKQYISSNISGIKLNRNAANSATLLTLESKEEILSSIMVGSDQKFCVQIKSDYDDVTCLPSLIWLEAELLEHGMMLLGYNNEKFKIVDVQKIYLEKNTDLYELSLNPTNTFYLVDSNGNLLLTHNISWLIGFIIAIVSGTVVGGGIGAGLMIYKSYARNVKISTSTVMKGFLIGAATGAITAAVTYGGIYVGIEYFPALLSKLSTFLGCTQKTVLVAKSAAANKLSNLIFIGTMINGVGFSVAQSSCNFIDHMVKDFVVETEKREGENINFSDINIKKAANKDFLGQTYKEMPSNPKVFYEEKFIDPKGNTINIAFAVCDN
jgi:hypothetical protein